MPTGLGGADAPPSTPWEDRHFWHELFYFGHRITLSSLLLMLLGDLPDEI